MSPVTHFLTGWAAANCAKLDRRERAIVTLACVVPDLDGVGIIPELLTRSSSHPLLWFTLYHHSLHSLAFAVVVATVAFVFAGPSLEDRPTCIAHLSHASIGRCAGLARAGWLPVAHSVLLAFRLEGAIHLERTVGTECVAKCSHHSNASGDHVLARLAPRVLAVGNGFAKSRCGFHLSFAPALPAHAGTSAEG